MKTPPRRELALARPVHAFRAIVLALLALFVGGLHSFAFTLEDMAGDWDHVIFYSNQPTVPVEITYTFLADGSVKSGDITVGSFVITGANADHLKMTLPAGPTYFDSTIASTSSLTAGTVDISAFSTGSGIFTATREGAGIVVEEPAGTPLVSGTSTVDFGNGFTVAAKPVLSKLKFIIKNTGKSPLAISDVAVASGPFHVSSKPGKKVAPGKNTSFTMQMTPHLASVSLDGTPPVPVVQNGKLLIFTDDPKTPIFTIKLTGNGGGFAARSTRYYFSLSTAARAARGASSFAGGFGSLTLSPTGWLSGRVTWQGVSYPVNGKIDPATGLFSTKIGSAAIPLTLRPVASGDKYVFTGSFGGASMDGYSAAYTAGKTAKEAGSYTLLLQTTDPSPDVPQGAGYARLNVSRTGFVRLVGRLADGTIFTTTGNLLASSYPGQSQYLFYNQAIYGGQGLIAGTIAFAPGGGSDCTGTLTWLKPAHGNDSPAAFSTQLTVTGARLSPP